MAGKGDKNNRITDWKKYRHNFDDIFRQPKTIKKERPTTSPALMKALKILLTET